MSFCERLYQIATARIQSGPFRGAVRGPIYFSIISTILFIIFLPSYIIQIIGFSPIVTIVSQVFMGISGVAFCMCCQIVIVLCVKAVIIKHNANRLIAQPPLATDAPPDATATHTFQIISLPPDHPRATATSPSPFVAGGARTFRVRSTTITEDPNRTTSLPIAPTAVPL